MADAAVVLDNVLCFLLARYSNTAIKQLKSVVLDFYSVEYICCAKENILQMCREAYSKMWTVAMLIILWVK